MKNLNYKELSVIAKEKGINPVGKSSESLRAMLSNTEIPGKTVKFKNKKGEEVDSIFIRNYLYPKTGETYLVVSVNGKNRLIRQHQVCS